MLSEPLVVLATLGRSGGSTTSGAKPRSGLRRLRLLLGQSDPEVRLCSPIAAECQRLRGCPELHDKMGDVIVVRVPLADRAAIIAADPEKYFITPHYEGFPGMLVRLPALSREELRVALTRSWRCVAPETLAATMR